MPTEPEHNMDKTLKAYADQRRAKAGAPAELHPATRRLLQGDVARVRPATTARLPWWQRLNSFWPRIAAAGVVVIASFLTFRSVRDETAVKQLARRDEDRLAAKADNAPQVAFSVAQESRVIPPASPAPVAVPPAPAPKLLLAKEQAAAPAPLRRKAESSGAVVGAAQADRSAVPAQKPASTDLSAATPVTRQPAIIGAAAEAEFVAGNAGQARNWFAKLGAATADSKEKKLVETTATVLDRFAVEQVGDQLNFIDADGSTYTGALEFLATTESNVVLQAGKAAQQFKDVQLNYAAPTGVTQNAGGAYRFRASGTNRTLRQPVIVDGFMEGTIVPVTNVIANNLSDQTGFQSTRAATSQDAAKQNDARYYYRAAGPQQPAAEQNALNRSLQPGLGVAIDKADAYKQQSQNWINASRIQGRMQVGGTSSPVQFFDAVPQTK